MQQLDETSLCIGGSIQEKIKAIMCEKDRDKTKMK